MCKAIQGIACREDEGNDPVRKEHNIGYIQDLNLLAIVSPILLVLLGDKVSFPQVIPCNGQGAGDIYP